MILITALALLAAPSLGGGVVVFQGFPGSPGNVVVTDPAAVLPSEFPGELQGIRLRAIDFNGRTELHRLQPDRPRLCNDIPGAGRLELPQGNGSLYRFSRVEPGGGTTFGLMLIDSTGSPRSVFELPGIGAGGGETPFKKRLAVAPGGEAVLIATRLGAGGNLLELDLASGAVLDRTSGLGPLSFGHAGLALASDWGIAVCGDRVLRFDRALAGDAQTVPFGTVGAAQGLTPWHSGELVLSPSGTFAATTAGYGPTSAHVWAFAASGEAVRVTDRARHLSGAGFLPASNHGPYLAISDDGTQCAWRTEGTTREAFLAPVPPINGAPQPSVHLTSDARYLDTLDEIGQFMFQISATTLRLAVGELETVDNSIENADFYDITPPTAGPLNISNLTLTNGIAAPPFSAPSTLTPVQSTWVPAAGGWVFYNERSGGTGDVVSVLDGQPGMTIHIPEVKDLDSMEVAGGELLFVVRSALGNKDREVWSLSSSLSGSPTLVYAAPDTHVIERVASRPDGWFAFVDEGLQKEQLWLYDTTGGTLRAFRRLLYGPTLDFAPTGELGFTVGAVGTQAIQASMLPTGGPNRLKVPVGPGFILP